MYDMKMNAFLVCFVFMTFSSNIRKLAISSLVEETYNTFLEFLNEQFNAPTKARSTKTKSTLV